MTVDMRVEETYNTKYLGEWDLPDDGKDALLTIKDVEFEKIFNPKNNSEKEEIVLYFEGDVKPMILSARVNMEHL